MKKKALALLALVFLSGCSHSSPPQHKEKMRKEKSFYYDNVPDARTDGEYRDIKAKGWSPFKMFTR